MATDDHAEKTLAGLGPIQHCAITFEEAAAEHSWKMFVYISYFLRAISFIIRTSWFAVIHAITSVTFKNFQK